MKLGESAFYTHEPLMLFLNLVICYTFREADNNQVPIGTSNLLLRGCVIRNTENVEGIVIYAGKHVTNDGYFGVIHFIKCS